MLQGLRHWQSIPSHPSLYKSALHVDTKCKVQPGEGDCTGIVLGSAPLWELNCLQLCWRQVLSAHPLLLKVNIAVCYFLKWKLK